MTSLSYWYFVELQYSSWNWGAFETGDNGEAPEGSIYLNARYQRYQPQWLLLGRRRVQVWAYSWIQIIFSSSTFILSHIVYACIFLKLFPIKKLNSSVHIY